MVIETTCLKTNLWSLCSNSIADQKLPVGCLFVLGLKKHPHLKRDWHIKDQCFYLSGIYYVPGSWPSAFLMYVFSTSYHKLARNVTSLFYRWENWRPEKLSDLPQIIQLLSGCARMWIQTAPALTLGCFTLPWCHLHSILGPLSSKKYFIKWVDLKYQFYTLYSSDMSYVGIFTYIGH